MLGLIDIERKWYELIGCCTYYVAFRYDINLGFSRSNFEMLYLRNGRTRWHGREVMRVNRMLLWHCDFKLWPQPWPWPWIFMVKNWNCCISGMGGSTHLEWKGCELDMMLDAQWYWPWAWQINRPSNGLQESFSVWTSCFQTATIALDLLI